MREEQRCLKDFVLSASSQLADKIKSIMNPLYTPQENTELADLARSRIAAICRKKVYRAQLDAICALIKGYTRDRCLGLIGEMGCGKTLQGCLVGVSLEFVTGHPVRTLVLCPPHLVSTWQEEVAQSLGDAVRVVNAGGVNALSLLTQLRNAPKVPDKPEFWLLGFNRSKTNYTWKPAFFKQTRITDKSSSVSNRLYYTVPHCDYCAQPLPDDMNFSLRNLCPFCGNPLWGPDGKARRVFAPVLYIKRYLQRHFQFVIFDEVQKLKGGGTIQGSMFGQLASSIKRSLILTGTLSGGKASNVYYLLQRGFALNYSKKERRELLPSYENVMEFVKNYGSIEEVHVQNPPDKMTGRASKEIIRIQEKPGISPALLKEWFLAHCVFLRISDMSDALPPYREEIVYCDLVPELAEAYQEFEEKMKKEVKTALKTRDMRVVGQMLPALLAWPDVPQQAVQVINRKGEVVAGAPALDLPLTDKDRKLIAHVRTAQKKGRKVLVFAEYTNKFQADEHVCRILAAAGFNFLVLKPTVPTDRRLAWIRSKMSTGAYDGLISQPTMVETGLNLLEFPEILFFQTGFNIYTLRQASRRSWRPGQTHPVVVRFFLNRATMQETAMALIASKLEASLVLEGELSDNGLVALSEIGDNMAVELARAMVGELHPQSLDAQFAAYRDVDSALLGQAAPQAPILSQLSGRPVLGPIIGSLCGMTGGTISGKLFNKTVQVRTAGDSLCLFDKHGVLGRWIGNDLFIERSNKYQGKYKAIPDCALPGMNAWRIHRIAA